VKPTMWYGGGRTHTFTLTHADAAPNLGKNQFTNSELKMESLIIAALRQDSSEHVFKYLAPRSLARLEQCLTSKLVFVPAGGGDALLCMVAGRQHVDAAKKGATMLVPLGEGRDGRVAWATELRWIHLAMGRLRAGGAKKMICVGWKHSLVTTGQMGEIWSFGSGEDGKLGHGGVGNETVPRLLEVLNRMVVRQVVAGYAFSMVLACDGNVWTWGQGQDEGFPPLHGALGHSNTDDQHVPKRVEGLTNVTDIAGGNCHGMALGVSGAVYTWGNSFYGQLGLGDHGERLVPTEVPGVSGAVAVAAGPHHSFALSRDGTVMACGRNDMGQLGLGDTVQRDTFTVVAGLCGVVDIDGGGSHTIAVTAEGDMWTWGTGQATGHGGDGQWLVPTKVTGGGIGEAVVVQVAAGYDHSMAKTVSGELYSWGKGYVGHGIFEHLSVPRVVGGIGAVVGMVCGADNSSLVITAEGHVLAFGSNGEDQDYDSDDEELDEPVFVVDGRGRSSGARGGGGGGSDTNGDRWDYHWQGGG
jgi:alpha-tubulin suppressor-like RCC1 family protein